MKKPSVGVAAAVTAMVAVGSAVTLSDGLVGYPVFGAQAMRYALAAAVLVAGLRATGRALPIPRGRDWIWLVLLAATGQGLYNVAFVGGVVHAEPAAIAVVVGLVPVVLTLAEAIRRRARPPASMLAGAGSSSLAPAAAQLGVLAVITKGPAAFPAPSADTVEAIVYIAVVVTAVAFALWYLAVQRLGASRAGLFAGLIPIAATMSGLGAGLTTISLSVLGGAVLVGAGIATALRRPSHSKPSRSRRAKPVGSPLEHANSISSPVNASTVGAMTRTAQHQRKAELS